MLTPLPCSACDGTGRVLTHSIDPSASWVTCEECGGNGEQRCEEFRCDQPAVRVLGGACLCARHAEQWETEEVEV